MDILLIPIVGVLNIACFVIGARVGQRVSRGEAIETPSLNPMQAIRVHQDRKKLKRQQDKFDIIEHNIGIYNGTDEGQKDVPR